MKYYKDLSLCDKSNIFSSKCLNQINASELDKEILMNLYNQGNVPNIEIEWISQSKNALMHKISLADPEIKLYLSGEGEESKDDWSEVWKNGKRIKVIEGISMDDYVTTKLREEYPETYRKYVKQQYADDYKSHSFDDKEIKFNGVKLLNEQYVENPL